MADFIFACRLRKAEETGVVSLWEGEERTDDDGLAGAPYIRGENRRHLFG